MKRAWKIAGWIIASVLISAAGVFVALPYFAVKERQPQESILSLAETLREQNSELNAVKNHKQTRVKKMPLDTETISALSKREEEVKQAMERAVTVYREKLREEMRRFHELEAQQKQLSRNAEEEKLNREWIDALGQNKTNIIFWLDRSVREAPRCYCVPSDVKIFLSGR